MDWIDVKDKSKKPEIGQCCLAWLFRQKEPAIVQYDEDSQGQIWRELVSDSFGFDREDLISHWLPITPPFEEK